MADRRAEEVPPDLTEFLRLSTPKRRPCAVGLALEQVKPGERDQVDAALATDQGIITNAAIEAWLKKRDIVASVSAIVSHRKGRCRCGRDA